MKWYKDGLRFQSGDSIPDTLRLDLVVVEDTGIYECQVNNVYGSDSVNSTLTVYGKLVVHMVNSPILLQDLLGLAFSFNRY